MGRLIAGVVALAVFICGAMYWSQAEQLQTMPQQPLCPGVTCADKAVTAVDNPCAVAPSVPQADAEAPSCKAKDARPEGGCPCCSHSGKAKAGKCPARDRAMHGVDA